MHQQIKTLEQTVHKRLKHTPAYEQLLTVDGIGTILAQTITLESGDMSRFPTVGNSASYCRCVNSTKISNGKRKGQGNVKNGNPYLGWAYIPTVSPLRIPLLCCHINGFQRASSVEAPWPGGEKRRDGWVAHPVA